MVQDLLILGYQNCQILFTKGLIMDKNNTRKDYDKFRKFGTENWFRLVVVAFLIMFSYQLNENW